MNCVIVISFILRRGAADISGCRCLAVILTSAIKLWNTIFCSSFSQWHTRSLSLTHNVAYRHTHIGVYMYLDMVECLLQPLAKLVLCAQKSVFFSHSFCSLQHITFE